MSRRLRSFCAVVAVCAMVALAAAMWPVRADDDHGLLLGTEPGPAINHPPAACAGGKAGNFSCANVDLLGHLSNQAMGGLLASDLWGWTDSLTGREYALLGLRNGTAFVDITNPGSPLYLGLLPTHTVDSSWRELKTYKDHAFVVSEASGHGMQVFDLRQLRAVVNPPVTFQETAHYGGVSNTHNITVDEESGYAYLVGSNTCGGGPHIVDIRNPSLPVQSGCYSAESYTHDSQCVVYKGPDVQHRGKQICFDSNRSVLSILDVTNKAAPVSLSSSSYPGAQYAHQGWLTEDHAYFLLDDELDEPRNGNRTRTFVWSMADLDGPELIGVYTNVTAAIDHNQFIRGNYSYQANYRSGLRVMDLSNIGSGVLREAGFFDTYPADDNPEFNSAWGNYPFYPSGTIAVLDIEQGLFLLRFNPNAGQTLVPNIGVSSASRRVSVRAGQAGMVPLTVTPQNGFNGTVSFRCSGLPTGAACTFSPATATVGAGPANVTLSISTSGPSASLPGTRGYWATFVLAGIFAGALSRKRAMFVIILILLIGMFACGGGSGSTSIPAPLSVVTPPGTSVVTVSVTSGAVEQSYFVNLTVQ